MNVTYKTTFAATCPVDESTDIYDLTVTMKDGWLAVEEILVAIAESTGKAAYQEEITQRLADRLGDGAIVETVGTHSGVLTTATARARPST